MKSFQASVGILGNEKDYLIYQHEDMNVYATEQGSTEGFQTVLPLGLFDDIEMPEIQKNILSKLMDL